MMSHQKERGHTERSPSWSGHPTSRRTPSISALASPTTALSGAVSPCLSTLKEVDDDAFAPEVKPDEADLLELSQDSLTVPALASSAHAPAVESAASPSPPTLERTSSTLSALGEILVISGGSGYNELLGATPGNTTYVMPISDNGGSSSEIIRTLSGPSIGDIRSRLVRLIPLTTSPRLPGRTIPPKSNDCLHTLLSYRLPTAGRTREIKAEWLELLEGKHRLWQGIEADRKEVVRGFLVHFQSEILRRAHRNFNLRGLSVGNAFLSAAQMFFRSIQSAIFLFSATTLVAGSGSSVLPCINTNHTATIAAELEDGSTIVGQCEISHPADATKCPPISAQKSSSAGKQTRTHYGPFLHDIRSHQCLSTTVSGMGSSSSAVFDPLRNISSDLHAALVRCRIDQSRRWQEEKMVSGPRTVGTFQDGLEPDDGDEGDSDGDGWRETAQGNIVFTKDSGEDAQPLPSRIRNIFYINSYRNIVWPAPNMSYLASLGHARTLIYSCGSLYTSIVPSLALRGVATAIARSATLRYKILLLNTCNDRETPGYTALDFVVAIQRALNGSDAPQSQREGAHQYSPKSFITHLVYHVRARVLVSVDEIQALGIRCIPVSGDPAQCGRHARSTESPRFSEADVRQALWQIVDESNDQADKESIAATSPNMERKRQMEGFTYLPLQ